APPPGRAPGVRPDPADRGRSPPPGRPSGERPLLPPASRPASLPRDREGACRGDRGPCGPAYAAAGRHGRGTAGNEPAVAAGRAGSHTNPPARATPRPSDDTLREHRVRDPLEPGDVGTGDVVAGS